MVHNKNARIFNSLRWVIFSVSIFILTVANTPQRQVQQGGISTGQKVKVNTNGQNLNLRQGPGISYAIVAKLASGTIMTVVNGPQSADGYVWWEIEGSNSQGWAAENFLTPLTDQQFVHGDSQEIICDPIDYYGIQHCGNKIDSLSYLLVNMNDPHVKFQVVLPVANQDQGSFSECNSVNTDRKDRASNCTFPYPFEKTSSMLERHLDSGGVALINTDYFGFEDGDHGAQGLTVRNGERLDGESHGVINNLAVTAPSLAISKFNRITIGFPTSQSFIDQHLLDIYYNATGGGPLIVENGIPISEPCQEQEFYGGDTCSKREQSAAGITKENQLVLITAKMNAEELASFLVDQFDVVTAIKFDGGGSARMVWLDKNDNINTYGVTIEDRAIAVGLLVFSEPASESEESPSDSNWQDRFLDWWRETRIYKSYREFINWIDETRQNIDKTIRGWEQFLRNIQDPNWWAEKTAEFLLQLCGIAFLPAGIMASVWISRRYKKAN